MTLSEFRKFRVCDELNKRGIDAVIATLPENIFYLTNGYESVVQSSLLRGELAVMYIPQKDKLVYIACYAEEPSIMEFAGENVEIYTYSTGFSFEKGDDSSFTERVLSDKYKGYANSAEAWEKAIKNNLPAGKKIAVDESRVFPNTYFDIMDRISEYDILSGTDVFMHIRRIKHPEEIKLIEKAAEIASESLDLTLKNFKEGLSAKDLEYLYNIELAKKGAVPHFCVITENKRAAFSDTSNSFNPIMEGSMIRFDFGCIYKGFNADLARTAYVGIPDEKLKTYFNAVKLGTEAGIALAGPGVTTGDVFDKVVEVVRQNGIPHYVRHHTGHGIGLEIYDMPSITYKSNFVMEENQTFCIEAPYYELGWGGVQQEDTIHITGDGSRYLDKTSRDLILL